MMLKRSMSESGPTWSAKLLRAGCAALLTVAGTAAFATGCLDRPVAPAVPKTSNIYIDQIRQTAVDKIDLLFMIDNSISMADKQQILAEAVPVLVSRLISPATDPMTGEPEFTAIKDIHVAVVTSSLGAHGGQICTDASQDDHGQALGAVRGGLPMWNNTGFLAWDPEGTKNNPPGTMTAAQFETEFTQHVTAAGETGCGYEASLEAWYRFLIDPDPVTSVTVQNNASVAAYPDTTVLAQRQAFLRPDSLVAIVMLTDENDCSIRDDNVGWLVGLTQNGGRAFTMPRATAACNTPGQGVNHPCCRSCASLEPNGPPSGCSALSADSECQINGGYLDNGPTANQDQLNLRCWDQKRRFGFDLLYPTARYVAGLTSQTIYNRAGQAVINPLFEPKNDKPVRDPGLIFLAGIIGVPWQDIADEASLQGAGLNYLTAQQIAEQGIWTQILGDPYSGVPPSDPFMIETTNERSGANPRTGATITPSSGTTPNAINGKEQTNLDNTDLQYACTFPLGTPRTCTDPNCDCGPGTEGRNRSLCSQSGAGAVGNTQYHAKAYPGLRHLQVLKDFGNNAIVASICPKNPTSANPRNDPNYGYNPAVAAIIDRLKEALRGRCLPRELVANDDGTVPCAVIEANPGSCTCDPNQRRAEPKTEEIKKAVLKQLEATGICGAAPLPSCNTFCMCEILQTEGDQLQACQNRENFGTETSPIGYCYVDAEQGIGNANIVANCPASSRRLLRFVGDDTPKQGSIAFIACLGATLGSEGMTPAM
jgi:hypothetical protein